MFQSVDVVISRLGGEKYICDRDVATVVYLACAMGKPILVEGPAGVGKTELGKVLASSLDIELIRLQYSSSIPKSFYRTGAWDPQGKSAYLAES